MSSMEHANSNSHNPVTQQSGSQPLPEGYRPRAENIIPDQLGGLQVVHLKGTPHEIGLTHGRLLSAEIAECYSIYRSFWQSLSDSEISQFARVQAEIIERAFPRYAEEMRAIAQGANVPYENIVALNSRTELAHYNSLREREMSKPPQSHHECTLLGDTSTRVLGENWDWSEKILPLTKLAHITLENGLEILTLTEPGIIGKVGMNNLGVAVGLNFIPGDQGGHYGIPVHLMLRRCLEAHSCQEAAFMLHEMPYDKLSTMSAITVMDKWGDSGVFEIRGDKIVRTNNVNDRIVAHTNHVTENPVDWLNHDLHNSETRLNTACRMAADKPVTVDVLKAILADRSDAANPINMTPLDWGVLGKVCSIRAVIFDLAKGNFHISKDAPGRVKGIVEYDSVNLYSQVL